MTTKNVPREPTQAMIKAGERAKNESGESYRTINERIWRAMYDAAIGEPQLEQEQEKLNKQALALLDRAIARLPELIQERDGYKLQCEGVERANATLADENAKLRARLADAKAQRNLYDSAHKTQAAETLRTKAALADTEQMFAAAVYSQDGKLVIKPDAMVIANKLTVERTDDPLTNRIIFRAYLAQEAKS